VSVHNWVFPVLDSEAFDGDSIRLTLDIGFRCRRRDLCRLLGVDAPEMGTDAGRMVKKVAQRWLDDNAPLMFLCSKHADKYGRPLGVVYTQGDRQQSLGKYLLTSGIAKEYNGGKRVWADGELVSVTDRCRELVR